MTPQRQKELRRDPYNGLFFGVCAGLADYFDTSPSVLRIALVVLMLMFPPTFFLYFIAALLIPKRTFIPQFDGFAERIAAQQKALEGIGDAIARMENYVTSDSFSIYSKMHRDDH